jgi:hypothetical protein
MENLLLQNINGFQRPFQCDTWGVVLAVARAEVVEGRHSEY